VRGARAPMRTCIGCRRRSAAPDLVRISLDEDGTLRLGPGPGRGAWLCGAPRTIGCLDAAVRRRAFERALRAPVPAPEVGRLRARMEGMSG